MALERIVLNIIPEGEMPVFHCSQYENGRPVIIDLVSSDDDAFLVPEGATVELHCRKVDDNIVTLEPDEVDNNTVTFVSTEQLTACPGDNLCEVVLYADTDPVQTIATLNFILHVEPDPLEGGLTSETLIHNLTEQIEEITQQVIGDDYYNKTEVDDLLDDKADKDTTYTKLEVDTALNLKADKSTTYTKTQVDSALALKADVSNVYTKSQTDTLLNAKANTDDLATVATTGDYDDLINKPSIPAAQVQSDYAQADNTKVDYIKNKPDINAMIANALLQIMPIGTASGPIANFDTELAVPLVNVSCNIVATGGYDADTQTAHDINGYTEANITRCGVNLWDEEWEVSGTGIASTNYTPVKPNTAYYFKIPTGWLTVTEYDINKNVITTYSVINNTKTLSSNCYFIKFVASTAYGTTYNNDISINYPATDTTYHAYTGNTYTLAFGQTVYGGVLDVTRGKLHVTHILKKVSDISWTYRTISGVTGYIFLSNDITGAKAGQSPTMASCYAIKTNRNYIDGDGQVAISNNTTALDIVVKDDTYTSADDFVQNRGNESFVFELATPFDIDLTPEVISAIVGENNVYSDTNGDTTVQYKDSIQHYIDQRV